MRLVGYLCGPEPVEITWDGDLMHVEMALEREWWREPIAYRARLLGDR